MEEDKASISNLSGRGIGLSPCASRPHADRVMTSSFLLQIVYARLTFLRHSSTTQATIVDCRTSLEIRYP